MTTPQRIISAAVIRLLKPLVRMMLRNNISHAAFCELAKFAYVEIASQEFTLEHKKQTVSRVATITGLTRREVVRIQSTEQEDRENLILRFNRAARVVAGWVRDPRFCDAIGNPAALEYDGEGDTFTRLAYGYSGDVPPRAVLDELVLAGVAQRVGKKIKLLHRAYVPTTSIGEKLAILGTDVSYLIETIDHNIYHTYDPPFFQRKVFYDNLPEEVIPKLHALTRDQGQRLIETLDQWMAQYDRDRNPQSVGTGRIAAGIGVYYFQSKIDQE